MSIVYNHFTLIDNERKLYKCDYCKYTHLKNFSTTSNMVAHLRAKHPGIFPPLKKRRLFLGRGLHSSSFPARPTPAPPQPAPPPSGLALPSTTVTMGEELYEDVKPLAEFVASVQGHDASPFAASESDRLGALAEDLRLTRSLSPHPPMDASPAFSAYPQQQPLQQVQQQVKLQPQPVHKPAPPPSAAPPPPPPPPRSFLRLSSPPPFSHPPASTSLPPPATPELEQLHARLLRAQIEREEAVARYYNALANRANTETALLRENK